jgi:hypothetical protein
MADRVPYTGTPEGAQAQGPRFEPTPEFHVEAPAAAFGTNIGQAVQGLGEVQEGAGKELFQRAMAFQDLTNHATARGASVKTAQEQAQLWADFDSKGGMAAGPEALKALQKNLDDIRIKNGSDLNPMANEYYQNDASSTQSRLFIYSASHSAQALKQYDLETIRAKQDTNNLLITSQPHDAQATEKAYAGNAAAATLRAHHGGYSPDSDIAKVDLITENSKTSYARIQGFADRQKPAEAKAALDEAEKQGRISGEWADKAHKLVESSQADYQSKDIVNKIHDPTKSEADNIKAVTDAANKAGLDARGVDATIAQERTKYAVDSTIKKQNLDRAVSTVNKAILDNTGKTPRTLDDYMQDPDYRAAFKDIKDNEDRAGQTLEELNKLNLQTIENDNNLTDNRRSVATQLTGMSHDPAQLEDFLKLNLRKVDLTMDQRKEFMRLQDSMRITGSSAGFHDKATEQVMSDMKQQITDGIGARGTTEYNEFRGALQVAFDNAREAGKVIDPKMATDIATKLLQDKVISPGYIWNTKGHAYQPSDAQAVEIRQQHPGMNLSDDDVQKIFLKKLNDVLIDKGSTNAPGQ